MTNQIHTHQISPTSMKVSTHKTFCSLYDTISDAVEMDVQHLRLCSSDIWSNSKQGKEKKHQTPCPLFYGNMLSQLKFDLDGDLITTVGNIALKFHQIFPLAARFEHWPMIQWSKVCKIIAHKVVKSLEQKHVGLFGE